MKVFTSVDELNSFSASRSLVATIGNFDGVHSGHKYLLDTINSQKKSTESIVVITFKPHPEIVINKRVNFLLTSYGEKYALLKSFGVDYILEINFDNKLRHLDPVHFFENYILSLNNLKTFYFGEDFSLGKNKCFKIENGLKLLEEKKIEGEVLSKIDNRGVSISSSVIREQIASSNFKEVEQLLGRPYSFSSFIIDGKKIGRKINYKTANLKVDTYLKYPGSGVYAVKVLYDGKDVFGAMNVGVNPTISSEKNMKIEVHILDFEHDLYGQILTITPVKKIRDEKKFNDLAELKNQIEKDILEVRKILHD